MTNYRLRGLGNAGIRAGGHRGPGLADHQDRAAVVQAGPTGLERYWAVWHCQAGAERMGARASLTTARHP